MKLIPIFILLSFSFIGNLFSQTDLEKEVLKQLNIHRKTKNLKSRRKI
jgi:hypothetical protein